MIRHFYFVFIIILIIGFIETKKYKIKLISTTGCEAKSKEKLDPTAATYTTSIVNLNRHTQAIRCNFTVLRTVGPITMSLKIMYLKGSRSNEIFKIEKVDCQNPVTYQLVRVINLKMTDDCKVMPGNRVTDDINIMDFSWVLAKAVGETGRYDFQLYFHTEKGLAICVSVVCDIIETKK